VLDFQHPPIPHPRYPARHFATASAERVTSTNAKLIPKEKPYARQLYTPERASIRDGSE
jgi:hypothetical protein